HWIYSKIPDKCQNSHTKTRERAPLHRGKAIRRCSRDSQQANPSRLTRPRQMDRMGLDRFAGMFTSKAPRPGAKCRLLSPRPRGKCKKNGQHPPQGLLLELETQPREHANLHRKLHRAKCRLNYEPTAEPCALAHSSPSELLQSSAPAHTNPSPA